MHNFNLLCHPSSDCKENEAWRRSKGVNNGYGGVIVVRSDRKINKVEDLKGSIVRAQQQNKWASNILQQGILTRSGINIFRDSLQISA